jgi:hypothetical protein
MIRPINSLGKDNVNFVRPLLRCPFFNSIKMSPGWDGHGLARWALERRCADKDSRQGLRLSSVDETYENGLDSGEEKQRNAFEAIRRF